MNSFTKIDDDFLEELEETLIMSDVGVETSEAIVEELRKKIKETGTTDPSEVKGLLKEIIAGDAQRRPALHPLDQALDHLRQSASTARQDDHHRQAGRRLQGRGQ